MPDETCTHIRSVTAVKQPKRRECEECVKIGAEWVHLRTCQECGGTRCCDNSLNKYTHTGKHPVNTHLRNPASIGCTLPDTFMEY